MNKFLPSIALIYLLFSTTSYTMGEESDDDKKRHESSLHPYFAQRSTTAGGQYQIPHPFTSIQTEDDLEQEAVNAYRRNQCIRISSQQTASTTTQSGNQHQSQSQPQSHK